MPTPQITASARTHFKLMPAMLWLMLLSETFGGGNATDVMLSCPHNFTDGQVSVITCAVNTTTISNAGCSFNPATLGFRFTCSSGIDSFLCAPVYPATSCAPQTTAGACFCANQSGEILTYQYSFVAGAGYQGGSFTCSICEVASRPPQQEISPQCRNISVETTTTSTTTSTTVTTTAVEPEPPV